MLSTTTPFANLVNDLGPDGQPAAYLAGDLSRAGVAVWHVSYPDEVPLINEEFPWIAATLD
jgi:hypothetical protein